MTFALHHAHDLTDMPDLTLPPSCMYFTKTPNLRDLYCFIPVSQVVRSDWPCTYSNLNHEWVRQEVALLINDNSQRSKLTLIAKVSY